MKFLVIRKPRVSGGITPTSKAIREHKENALNALKRGTLECIYGVPGGGLVSRRIGTDLLQPQTCRVRCDRWRFAVPRW